MRGSKAGTSMYIHLVEQDVNGYSEGMAWHPDDLRTSWLQSSPFGADLGPDAARLGGRSKVSRRQQVRPLLTLSKEYG